ncbi:MAG TPA: glycosyltransferase family 4 protein [Gaiellaceae bacterium]|nr:glycosyltransferase family 4 protein [Gaiellaceae bacterium]
MRLVFVTQTIDSEDPNLAIAVDWVRALALRCDEVRVVADRVRAHDLPENVTFSEFGAGSRLGRGARYERAVSHALRDPRPDAVLVHMLALLLVLAAPLARARRVPLLLWYAHWRRHWALRLADRLCAATLSVDRSSYPLRSPKLRPIGHGIDVERFAQGNGRPRGHETLHLLALGRMAPWKGFATLLDGFEEAVGRGLDARLEIRGPSTKEDERLHREHLAARIAGSPVLSGRAQLAEPLPREQIPELLAGSDALVTAADSGHDTQTLDKVVYEASACAVPVIASNPALAEYLDGLPLRLDFRPHDPHDLARALVEFAAAPESVRLEVGRELRRRVETGHSVDTWAARVLAVVEDVRR